MVSPPKPWERNPPPSTSTTTTPTPTMTPSATTQVPERPTALPPTVSSIQPNAYSSYSSPYSRFGSPYSAGLGPYGMGSYGGGYGSYGGYGGMGYGMGMGMGMPGMLAPGDPSLTQSLESTTQHTFALLHSIVQTFTGVAHMLESSFFATHSSFFAMVGVLEQFAQLRAALGSVLGLFGLVRWLRERISGKSAEKEMRKEFREFINGKPVQGPMPARPAPSKKPLVIFLLAVFGVPYVMSRLLRALRSLPPPVQGPAPATTIDPSSLQFARALYAFEPSTPQELSLKPNEIVAIMGKLDPATGTEVDPSSSVESEWWRGRTREGREGWFPRKWVEVLEKREAKQVD